MEKDKVIVGFEKYHNQMNELTFLKDLALELYFDKITIEEFRKQLEILNHKFIWWC